MGFYPSEISCLSSNHHDADLFVRFINSWFYPEHIGGYTVSLDSNDMECSSVPDLDLPPVFLGLSIKELEKFFGHVYDVGVHSTAAAKKTGLYGKRYIQFETERVLKKVKIGKGLDEEQEIEIKVVLVAKFTLSDNDLVQLYSIVQHEEPVSL